MNIAASFEPPFPPVFVKRGATLADVDKAPEGLTAQLVDDGLSLQPRPALKQSRVVSALAVRLGGPFDLDPEGPGGWWILVEPELRLPGAVLVPDLAGWRRARMPVFPDTAACSLVPDWVCEVLSPGTRGFDLGPKRGAYAAQGVRWLWIIDPDARLLEAFELIDGRWTLLSALLQTGPAAIAPFEAISFPIENLWPDQA